MALLMPESATVPGSRAGSLILDRSFRGPGDFQEILGVWAAIWVCHREITTVPGISDVHTGPKPPICARVIVHLRSVRVGLSLRIGTGCPDKVVSTA